MKAGAPMMVTPTDNHVVHADVHLKAGSDAAQSLQAGADMMEILGFLEAIGPHVRQHLDQFADDPTRTQQSQALEASWKKLASFTDQLAGQVQQMQAQQQQAAEQQQSAMNDEMLKQAKTESDIQRKDKKARVDMELKVRKAEQQEAIKDVQTANQIQRDRATQAAAAESKAE
jgi:hypothetical protein